MNIERAEIIIKQLVNLGIRCFCLCPGGRVAPFVEVLSHSKGVEVLFFFEERSAGFFALGRARRDNLPVAVLSTSGTAVAELLPATIEAHYSALPLVLITADRPLSFGKKACPQTLRNALQILQNYCHTSKNILKNKDIHFSKWEPQKGSLHLNVCFDEPLIDQKIKPLDFSRKTRFKHPLYKSYSILSVKNNDVLFHSSKKTPLKMISKADYEFNKKLQKNMRHFFKFCKKPLILVGELKKNERSYIKELLSHYKGLFYTEPLSGLDYLQKRLLSGEKILSYSLAQKEIDGMIRLGGIPRSRFWRDLEKKNIPVLNLSSPPFYPGLARPSLNGILSQNKDLLSSYLLSLKEFGEKIKTFDQIQLKKWKEILNYYPKSEESWLLTIKKSLKRHANIFLGNSTPIRAWDNIAFCKKKNLHITGQSGVNGIEGLVSRFLGECDSARHNIGILGDLSVLYDMAGLWKSKEIAPWTLIVINNFGGQFFSRLFKNPAFLNNHRLNFSCLAKMWGVNYKRCIHPENFIFPKSLYNIIEIRPKAKDTKTCFKKYLSLWNSC